MNYLTLDLIKAHLNLDTTFTADDTLLTVYGEAAEKSVENYIDAKLADIVEANDDELPKPLLAAMLMLTANLYLCRESISTATFVKIPDTIQLLFDPYIDYTCKPINS